MKLKENRSDEILQNQYKIEKKGVKASLNKAKIEYSKNELLNCKGDISKTWRTIKKIIPSSNNPEQLNYDDNFAKANEFNKFFATVGKNAFEKSQETVNDNDIDHSEIYEIGITQRFRPNPFDVGTVILTV